MKTPSSTQRISGDYGVSIEVQKEIISQVESHFQGVCLDASSGSSRAFADADTDGLMNYYQHFYGELGELIDFVVKSRSDYDKLFEICGKYEVYRFSNPPKSVRKSTYKYSRDYRPSTSLHFIVLVPYKISEDSNSEISVHETDNGEGNLEQMNLFDLT